MASQIANCEISPAIDCLGKEETRTVLFPLLFLSGIGFLAILEKTMVVHSMNDTAE